MRCKDCATNKVECPRIKIGQKVKGIETPCIKFTSK